MIQSESGNRRLLSGLAHGDFFVRSTALSPIAGAPKPGIEATRLAIAAIERDGHREAFERPHRICSAPTELNPDGIPGWTTLEPQGPAARILRRMELASQPDSECLGLIGEGIASIAAANRSDRFPHAIINDLNMVCDRLVFAMPTEVLAGRFHP
jgi:hypothetical protein